MPDIINPYIAGNPVTGPEMFFGREDVFEFVRQTLIGQHRDNVIVFYGQRRTGKTSVLYQMRSHLDPHYLCILVDLHGFALESLRGFLWELANHIARMLHRDYQINLPPLSRADFMIDPHISFEDEFLGHLWSAVGTQHLLLMFDEVIRLQEQVQAGILSREIFEYMRYLVQHHKQLNFLFSLGSGLEEMQQDYAFLFNVALYKKISFLDSNAAHALITQPVKDCYHFEQAAVEQIMRITSCHPYYIQLMCHCLFTRWQQKRVSPITSQDVDDVLDESVERGLAVLKHVWEESTAGEKAIMVTIAEIADEPNRLIETNIARRTWANHGVTLPAGEIAKATRNLVAREVIGGQGKYTFTVDLQRLWVQKYKRLEWVKEEIADTIRGWAPRVATSKPPSRWERWRILLQILAIAMILLVSLKLLIPTTNTIVPIVTGSPLGGSQATVNSAGSLVATFKEAGLGTTVSTKQITLSASASATYACINGGGNHPKATNKETVSGPVGGTGTFPVRNGQTTGSITVAPPGPGGFSCPSGQKLVLASVSYTNVKLTGLAGDTAKIPGTFSACLFPGVGICLLRPQGH